MQTFLKSQLHELGLFLFSVMHKNKAEMLKKFCGPLFKKKMDLMFSTISNNERFDISHLNKLS